MTRRSRCVASAAILVSSLAVGTMEAQQTPGGVTPSATSRAPEPPGPPVPLGPYTVTIEADPRLPTHTIYRPSDLGAAGLGRIPLVAWGNGACANNGTMFMRALTTMASHGFVIIAIGPITHEGDYPGATIARLPDGVTAPAPARGTSGMAVTRASMLTDALDWAVSENARDGSRYRGRLDPERIGVMGQSCGGLQALEVAGDPRIRTMVIWNSGVFNTAGGASALSGATKEGLAAIHSPIAYINGGPSDIAYENSNDDVRRLEAVPLFYGVMNEAGHAATFSHVNGGQFAEVGANWLLWQLRDDAGAARMFVGADCELCTDPEWTVQKKNME